MSLIFEIDPLLKTHLQPQQVELLTATYQAVFSFFNTPNTNYVLSVTALSDEEMKVINLAQRQKK